MISPTPRENSEDRKDTAAHVHSTAPEPKKGSASKTAVPSAIHRL